MSKYLEEDLVNGGFACTNEQMQGYKTLIINKHPQIPPQGLQIWMTSRDTSLAILVHLTKGHAFSSRSSSSENWPHGTDGCRKWLMCSSPGPLLDVRRIWGDGACAYTCCPGSDYPCLQPVLSPVFQSPNFLYPLKTVTTKCWFPTDLQTYQL